MSETKVFDTPVWAVVELMGRQVIAGQIQEVTIAGAGMLRVDVPAVESEPGYTKFFGASSIYAITPTEENVVRCMVVAYRHTPIQLYSLPAPHAPLGEWDDR